MQNTKSPPQENPTQTPKKENTILKELTSASIILALVTSLLYISGATYLHAYLTEWGIDSSLIPSNTQELLIHGVSVFYIGGFHIISFGASIGFLLFSCFYLMLEISKSTMVRKISSKIYKILNPKRREEPEPPLMLQKITKLSLQFFTLFLFLLMLLVMFYQLVIFSSSQGKEKSKKEYIEFSTSKITNETIFTRKKLININGEEKEGYILANSDNLIGLYLPASEGKEEQVVIVPLSSVSHIKALKNHNVTIETKK